MKMRILVGAALAVVASAGLASAQPDYKAAAEHYKAAETAMAAGDFSGAALEYGIAYDITKDPILFFKIGQANQRAGKCPVALTYYNRYLREGNPSDEYRTQTTAAIAACTPGGTGATPGGDQPPPGGDQLPPGGDQLPPGGDQVPPDLGPGDGAGPTFIDQPASWKRTGAWVSTGLTVGLVAAGVVLAMSAEGSEEDIQSLIDFRNNGRPVRYDEVRAQYESLDDDGQRFDTLSTAAFIGAGVTAAVATTLFVLDRGHAEPATATALRRLRPSVGRHGGGVAVGWEF